MRNFRSSSVLTEEFCSNIGNASLKHLGLQKLHGEVRSTEGCPYRFKQKR